jgi:hypothetical protein
VLGGERAEAMLALAAAALEPGDAPLRLFDAIEQACVDCAEAPVSSN